MLTLAGLASLGNSPDPGDYNLAAVGIAAEETLVVPATGQLRRTYTFIATLQSEEPPEWHGVYEVQILLSSGAGDTADPTGPYLTTQVVRSDGALLDEVRMADSGSLMPIMAEPDTCLNGCAITFDLVLESSAGEVVTDVVLTPMGQVHQSADMRAVVRIEPNQ